MKVVLLNSSLKLVKGYKSLQDVDDCFLEESTKNANLINDLKNHYAIRYNGFFIVTFYAYYRRDGFNTPFIRTNKENSLTNLTIRERRYLKKMNNSIYVFNSNMHLIKLHIGSVADLSRSEKISLSKLEYILCHHSSTIMLAHLTNLPTKIKNEFANFYIYRKDLIIIQETLGNNLPIINDLLSIDTSYLM